MFITKRKNGIYYLIYSDENGRRKWLSTKERKKTKAIQFLINYKSILAKRQTLKVIPINLIEFRDRYIKHSLLNHTPKTTKTIEQSFKHFIDYIGNPQLIDISIDLVTGYFDKRIKESSVYQARKDLINLKSAFNNAVMNKFISINPFVKIRSFKIPEKLPVYFTQAEFETLKRNMDIQVIKDISIVAVNTGLRQMELLNLTWNQIDFKERLLILTNQEHITKSKKIRTIPLNMESLQVLTDRQKNRNAGDYVFYHTKKKIGQSWLYSNFKKAIRKAGLSDKLNFHSLRHTFASWLVQKDVPIFIIKELLGHSDISVTEIYSHLKPDNLRRSLDLLNHN